MENEVEHYFTEKPKSKPRYGKIFTLLRGRKFEFLTCSGVFSYKKIDRGTELLVRHMQIGENDRVLDLGCGYGVLGIVAAKLTKNKVILTDINKRAVMLAKRNLGLNNIKNAEVRRGNLYEPVENETFDVILCNLPITAGLEVVYKIIEGAKERLNEGGTLQVVVRKGHERVKEKILEVFGNVKTLSKRGGYRVYLAVKKPG